MIATEKQNFAVAHYDWLALAVGAVVLVLGLVVYVMALGENADDAAAAESKRLARLKPAELGVKAVDLSPLTAATRLTKSPQTLADVPEKTASFLASERRVMCKCGKAISGDVKAVPACPYCGEKQQEEAPVILDADGDGLPDEWEKRYGLNPAVADADSDLDGDGFTNLEEFQAKTDPKDKTEHPDYLDSLTLQLPLKETYMPFIFIAATKIPTGWRCEFFDAKQKDDYGRMGKTIRATIGEEIGTSGFVLKGYEKKTTKRAIKGSVNQKEVDVSEVKLERKADGKVVTLVMSETKKAKPAPVDVQATLVYERMGTKTFDVVPLQKIELNGTKYQIASIKATPKGATVTILNERTGKKHDILALAPNENK